MKFRDTLEELEKISRQLKDRGIIVEDLNKAITDLKTHQENIEKIEENIDAIKQEVISPLKKELDENRTAGKFSIFGFWVGAAGLIVAIGTIIYGLLWPPQFSISIPTDSKQTEISKKIDALEKYMLFPKKIVAKEGERFIEEYALQQIASEDRTPIYMKVSGISKSNKDNVIAASIKLFKGENQINYESVAKMLVRSDSKPERRDWFGSDAAVVAKGDSIKIGNVTIEIIQVYSKEPMGRLMGDEKTGILVKPINQI